MRILPPLRPLNSGNSAAQQLSPRQKHIQHLSFRLHQTRQQRPPRLLMVLLSSAEWAYIADGIAQDLRNDGRGREEYRPITIETGVVPQVRQT